jgi:FKBP-type peptidyl-prolyl cis-trans isomerase FkpA
MKSLATCLLGLTLAVSLTACDRAKAPAADNAAAGAPAATAAAPTTVAFQKIDTQAGTGKEATAGATAVVNYTGWLFDPAAPAPSSTPRKAATRSASAWAAARSSRAGTRACKG